MVNQNSSTIFNISSRGQHTGLAEQILQVLPANVVGKLNDQQLGARGGERGIRAEGNKRW